MRKVDIRTRIRHLNEQLLAHKETAVSQAAERAQLIEACRSSGDHVYVPVWTFVAGVSTIDHQFCEFCGMQHGASREQLARNLVRG